MLVPGVQRDSLICLDPHLRTNSYQMPLPFSTISNEYLQCSGKILHLSFLENVQLILTSAANFFVKFSHKTTNALYTIRYNPPTNSDMCCSPIFPPTSCKNCSPTSITSSAPSEDSSLVEESPTLGVVIFRITSLFRSDLLRILAITVCAVGCSCILTALHTQVNNGALTRIM